MCHMKTIQDTTFDRKEGRVSQREEEWRGRGAQVLGRRPALPLRLTCRCSGRLTGFAAARVEFCVAGRARPRHPALGAQPSGMDILLRDLSSELTTGPDFHHARKS